MNTEPDYAAIADATTDQGSYWPITNAVEKFYETIRAILDALDSAGEEGEGG
jgi:hypothetical protein